MNHQDKSVVENSTVLTASHKAFLAQLYRASVKPHFETYKLLPQIVLHTKTNEKKSSTTSPPVEVVDRFAL